MEFNESNIPASPRTNQKWSERQARGPNHETIDFSNSNDGEGEGKTAEETKKGWSAERE